MKLAVNCKWGRRGARAKARSSPPCFFNLLMTSQVDQELHHLTSPKKLSRQWGALQSFDLRQSTFEAFLKRQAKWILYDFLKKRGRIKPKKRMFVAIKGKLEGLKAKLRGPRRIPEQLFVSVNVPQDEGGPPDIPQDSPAPSTLAALNDDYLELSAAIEKLQSLCREIIELFYFDDLHYREIATTLDIPIGTVKSRLSNCLIELNGLFPKDFWNNRRESSNEQ